MLRGGQFTLSVAVQCSHDDAPLASHLPISMSGVLSIGASRSRESLSLGMGGVESQLLYPPGQENRVGETRVCIAHA